MQLLKKYQVELKNDIWALYFNRKQIKEKIAGKIKKVELQVIVIKNGEREVPLGV